MARCLDLRFIKIVAENTLALGKTIRPCKNLQGHVNAYFQKNVDIFTGLNMTYMTTSLLTFDEK